MIEYIVKSKKLITVDKNYKSIENGGFVVKDGMIIDVGIYDELKDKYVELETLDFGEYIVTPSLVDCHTHVLEYAPSSFFPVTEITHFLGGLSLILRAITSGVTALGEQLCGHPGADFGKEDYEKVVKNLPIDIVFSISTISLGLKNMVHFSGLTGAKPITNEQLMDKSIIEGMIDNSDYPGENIFINATPANFEDQFVPRAGEIIYFQEELNYIVNSFHLKGKTVGCHVAGEEAIDMAIEAGFDVIHHGHGINESQIKRIKDKDIVLVATPLGGTHLAPNSPDEILKLYEAGIDIAISTDAYLPPSKKADYLSFNDNTQRGPESLMILAHGSMKKLKDIGIDENEILSLITLQPAKVLLRDHIYGSISKGKDANFIVAKGIPGLEIKDPEDIKEVFFKGDKVISK